MGVVCSNEHRAGGHRNRTRRTAQSTTAGNAYSTVPGAEAAAANSPSPGEQRQRPSDPLPTRCAASSPAANPANELAKGCLRGRGVLSHSRAPATGRHSRVATSHQRVHHKPKEKGPSMICLRSLLSRLSGLLHFTYLIDPCRCQPLHLATVFYLQTKHGRARAGAARLLLDASFMHPKVSDETCFSRYSENKTSSIMLVYAEVRKQSIGSSI